MTKRLSSEGFKELASQFRLLADPVRLEILDLLRFDGELGVGEVARAIGCSHANASRQLARLRDGGAVARRQDGNAVHYRIADASIFALCEMVCGRVERQAARPLASLYTEASADSES